MAITRYHGEQRAISAVFPSDPLVPYGLTYADIDDISMSLKLVPAVDADDAYIQKTQGGGGVFLDQGNHTITMTLDSADYVGVTPADYDLVIALEVDPVQDWIELCLDDPRVRIVDDAHRS